MSLTDNESNIIQDFLKQLRDCADFLTRSANDIENDYKKCTKTEASVVSGNENENFRKHVKKIYTEVQEKIHHIDKCSKDIDAISSSTNGEKIDGQIVSNSLPTVTDDDQRTSGESQPEANRKEKDDILPQVTNGTSFEDCVRSKTPEISKEPVENKCDTKIRLVAIEKLLDPKIIASASAMRNALPIIPCPIAKPCTALNISESITILDSDEDIPEPSTSSEPVAVVNNLTNGIKEKENGVKGKENGESISHTVKNGESIPLKVKPFKIRINRCKVSESLLKSGKREIKVSNFFSISKSSKKDNCEIRSSKRRRFDSSESISSAQSSGEDADYVPKRKVQSRNERNARRKAKSSERSSSRAGRSKSNLRNSSDEDGKSKKRKEKDGEKKDSKQKNKSKSKKTDDDGQSDAGNCSNMESDSGKMGSNDPNEKNNREAPSTSKKSAKSCDESENSDSEKENSADKTKKGRKYISSESSSDEFLIKRKGKNRKEGESSKAKENNTEESSSDEKIVNTRKKNSKRKRIRTSSCSDSPSPANSAQEEGNDDSSHDKSDSSESDKQKKKKKKRRIKGNDDGSESDAQMHRKKIRKVIKTNKLDEGTKKASEAEKERRKRVEEKQKLYNQLFEKPESAEIAKAVLDFDPETKKELLSIDKGLLKKLKPHQVEGVKFMWDACFETVRDIESTAGSGCILGHCMGLGKTLQVVALSHTLLANSQKTHVNTVLVISPLSTVTNWAKEFDMWLRYCKYKNIEVYDMTKFKDKRLRGFKLKEWHEDGGVCVIGYDMFRILCNPKIAGGKNMRKQLQESLVDPGPDVIVCDEGHLLKNEKTSISKAVSLVRTQRRIVLSGTPLQNNLKEYYCMVQFVKPNLLGTYKEYMNRFVNPITNGQYTNSTEWDIRLMKNRSHVLHKMLEGCIQRRDYSVLAPYLPPKHEYVVFIALSDLQKKLYDHYMKNERLIDQSTGAGSKGAGLFKDFQNLRRIWTHPMALRVNSDEVKKKKRKAEMEGDDSSLDGFIASDNESTESGSNSSKSDSNTTSNSEKEKKSKTKTSKSSRRTRQNANPDEGNNGDDDDDEGEETACESEWWKAVCSESELINIHHSPKLMLLFEILRECESIGDKVLLFSQSLQSLEVIEAFLAFIDKKTSGIDEECDVNGFTGSWKVGLDYFRLDGSNSVEAREMMCRRFNNARDTRVRLFLISTRAGSLGINLVAANRVIIFDASWNPSHDTQSIFRVYRFGQEKPCYIYRFIAIGTMEEKIYERQVMKQATAKRVIDEHQIGRHYTSNDLIELYQYDITSPEVREIPILPKDRLFAEMIKKHEEIIVKYHEHDSLLENKESENLSEEERKAAWAEYENEKNQPPPSQYVAYNRPNYRTGPVTSSKIFGFRSDVLLRLLNIKVRSDHPHVNDAQVGQLVPHYLRQLYEQMNTGVTMLYNELCELNELNQSYEIPMGFAANLALPDYNAFYEPQVTDNYDRGWEA